MSEMIPDVLILGGGVIGLACAHYLLSEGRSVLVLEKGQVGGAASHGNCGTLTPSHAPPLAAPGTLGKALKWMLTPDAPFYVKPRIDPALARWLLQFAGQCNRFDWRESGSAKAALLGASRGLIETLIGEHALDCEFSTTGLHDVYRQPQAFETACKMLPKLAQFGIESRVLGADQLAADEPALLPGMAGAIHFPGDAHLRPDRYCSELARLVRDAGGVIEEQTTVTAVECGRRRVVGVSTSQGRRMGRDVLLAMGSWSPLLASAIGIRLPIQPGKGYSITYDRPLLVPRRPLVLHESSVCVTAWGSGYRLGSTMEFSGYDDTLNRRRLDALERGARDYLCEPVGPVKREEWFGWRPMTPDDVPILGRAPGHDNLWLATGHGMLGISMSAGTGRLLADLICRREAIVDPAPYSLERF